MHAQLQCIVNNQNYFYDTVNPSVVNRAVTTFGPDSVMVTVAWQQERGASYNVSVFPQVVVNMSGPTTLQLTLAYNTLYNVTIATIVCGQTLSTTVTQLHYGECFKSELFQE